MQETTKHIVNMNTESSMKRKETKDIEIETDVPEKSHSFPNFLHFLAMNQSRKMKAAFQNGSMKYYILLKKADILIK